MDDKSKYCKFGNFRENFVFANGVKRHICDMKNSQARHDSTCVLKAEPGKLDIQSCEPGILFIS